jgi:simple sugar transport system substrate-binding protein
VHRRAVPGGAAQVKHVAALGAAAAVALVLCGCSGDSDGPAAATATTAPTTTAGQTPAQGSQRALRLIVVTHGQASDPFWAVVRKGIDEAARDLGVDVSYRASDVYAPARMRRLVQAAVAEKPDGLVVTIPSAAALAPPLRQAARARIPVVAINAGTEVYRRLGALLFVGEPEFATGVAAGRRMAALGVRNAICVIHQAGVASLQQRCRGFAQGLASSGGRSIVVTIELQQQREAVGRLIGWVSGATGRIDGVLALGPAAATPALAAVRQERAFESIKVATFGLAPDILRALRDGEIQFAIDEQPYLQGYLPVVFLAQRARYGLAPGAGTMIPTGPDFVTRADVPRLERLTDLGIR